jgi:hypothetical protein
MTFNNNAIIMPPLQQQLWDKTLNVPLSGGFVQFFRDSQRTTPKDVYQLTGTGPGSYTYTNLGSVLTLSGIGTYVDANGGNIAIYLWPFTGSPNDDPPSQIADNYYIEVYSSTNVFQFDIPNWPGVGGGSSSSDTADTTDNVLSNAQFVEINFPSDATRSSPWMLSLTGTQTATEIAPDWSLVTTGNGTVSLYREQISDNQAPGNPAYALGINTTGFTQPIILRQRIFSPRLFVGQFVSATFIVESLTGGAFAVTMNYTPSLTGMIQQLCTGATIASGFTRIFNDPAILISDPGSGTGYVDITLVFPQGQEFQFSCVQLCGVASETEIEAYLEQTPARIEDQLFHYWNPYLQFKPIPSLLVGWDFVVNPVQFTSATITTTPGYICDQTIAATSSGTVNFGIDGTTSNAVFNTTANNQAWYILQYLSGDTAFEIVSEVVSSLVTVYSPGNPGCLANVYMFYSNGGGTIPTLPTTIGTVNSSGVFTLTAANWAEITQFTPTGAFEITAASGDEVDMRFFGFNAKQYYGSSSTANFAIVVTFMAPTLNTDIDLLSVSLNKGYIATRPAPQTPDEVLRECQYYYEKSYDVGTVVGTATSIGQKYAYNGVIVVDPTGMTPSDILCLNSFQLEYKTVKRVAPNVVFYAPDGTSAAMGGSINIGIYRNGSAIVADAANPQNISVSTDYITTNNSTNRLLMNCKATTPAALTATAGLAGDEGKILYHYVADARLGIV